ncbi:MAG: HPr family phosphocarrier protein [Candidatus Riflebacteria bacterium]|nr:HPr family phosphocarrier protein [Candidatus Riflebacteria bacterium]
MKRKDVEIKNKFGLHARPASLLVKLAGNFECDVQIVKDDMEVNAKSILGVMMLAAGPGNVITVVTDGSDEEEAIQAVTSLIEGRFGEEEASS